MLKKEIAFYKDARIADEGLAKFQLCGQFDHNGERWAVAGEVGSEWLEMHEVGTYFNFEEDDENYDGVFYYVGTMNLEPLRPHYSELQSSINFLYDHPNCCPADYSTRLAYQLLRSELLRGE